MSCLGIRGIHAESVYFGIWPVPTDMLDDYGLSCVVAKISGTHVIQEANLFGPSERGVHM